MSGHETFGAGGDTPVTRHAPASVFADFVPPSFTASARREALDTPFRRVTISVPNSRRIVVNKIFSAQGFKPASDLMVMGEYRLLSYNGIGSKTLEGIRVGLQGLDESLELPRNPGPEYAAYLCGDLEEIPVQVLSPNLFEYGQNDGQRITVAHALGALPCWEIEIPDYVQARAQQYAADFTATREGML